MYSEVKKMGKRKLTEQQEFEIMKLVLDKFLWLGVGIMFFGLYNIITGETWQGVSWIIGGIIVVAIFAWIIVKEYELTK